MRAIIVLLLSALLLVLSCGTASSSTLYVPDGYPTIQAAVDNATAGDTIVIRNGTYLENVVVNKSITITSDSGPDYTTVNASNESDNVFTITASNVSITGLTIGRARDVAIRAGVYLGGVQNCTISNNVITGNARGIYVSGGGHHNISHNRIESNSVAGIYMYYSSHNTITDSYMGSNGVGVCLDYYCDYNTLYNNSIQHNSGEGVYLDYSSHNTIANCSLINNSGEGEVYLYLSDYNTIENSSLMSGNLSYGGGRGMFMDGADHCTIRGNIIRCNYVGIYLYSGCDNNLIYNNLFNHSQYDAYVSDARFNRWNITKTPGRNIVGGPYLGGNYWSTYNGTDTNGDGLGDTPYTVAGLNVDYLPLVRPAGPSPPVALFHTLHEINNVGVPVRFISDSYDRDGTIVSWTWDFGDGTNATGENVSHTYSAYRWDATNSTYLPYSVSLTVVDNSSANNTTTRAVMVYMAGGMQMEMAG
ncbi:NosD domain-containing protein [Methermicoccus shengliensis]|uniref:PKD domain-containing protein n=1 Tax=Methermicoccus shengliensis TaxID=660064 RepID=A0A832RZX2_9EURY|nr:NosD domain-containing protein [Methermicoccus shengliensis]KUK29696.1 MAG: Cell surface protein [Methanosarcinales archeaon 56_1174]MDI3488035.1 hypothetical protein [Methanosarcinales archaeon]MDN5295656.1 hypothetical protein [Methanosarcinales archaeon]HIH70356.1 PKD domain-containing protein [Methermicoccus shengliensis]